MINPSTNRVFSSESVTQVNNINPLQPSFHYRMLNQLKAYHENAKKNPNFSLLSSLQVISKFCVTDIWLNALISDEIDLLKQNNVVNPYFQR